MNKHIAKSKEILDDLQVLSPSNQKQLLGIWHELLSLDESIKLHFASTDESVTNLEIEDKNRNIINLAEHYLFKKMTKNAQSKKIILKKLSQNKGLNLEQANKFIEISEEISSLPFLFNWDHDLYVDFCERGIVYTGKMVDKTAIRTYQKYLLIMTKKLLSLGVILTFEQIPSGVKLYFTYPANKMYSTVVYNEVIGLPALGDYFKTNNPDDYFTQKILVSSDFTAKKSDSNQVVGKEAWNFSFLSHPFTLVLPWSGVKLEKNSPQTVKKITYHKFLSLFF